MTEDQRQRAIMARLGRMADRIQEALPTGFPALDAALGIGGLPRGRIVEIFGPPSCGKTDSALRIVARAQRDRLTAAWIDAERSFDPPRAAALGVLTERLAVAQPVSAEQAMEIAIRLAATCAVDLLVIDSMAALVPRLELAANLGDSGPSLHARVLASGLRRLRGAAARSGMVALCLNQTRSAPHAAAEETSAGGPALKLHAAVRITLSGTPGADRVRFRIVKNQVASAHAAGDLEWGAEPKRSETR